MPAARAELVAQWIERFAPRAAFRAIVAADGGQYVAALPLVGRKLAGCIPAGGLPANEWVSGGDLLVDPTADVDAAIDLLAAAVRNLPWPLLWLDEAPLETTRWQSLHWAFGRAAAATLATVQYRVAQIDVGDDWESYRRSWSRKHRQNMASAERRLGGRGDVRLATLCDLAPQEVEVWLRRGFEVEHRGWKGRAGSSVLAAPGIYPFFAAQARQLAEWRQLELNFLEAGGRPIAFAYGMAAKGVYHSCKIGYDPEYADYSPGQLLRCRMLERFYASGECRRLDCQGPLSAAHAAWRPATYGVGRLVVAPGRRLGRAVLESYRRLRPLVRRLRGAGGGFDQRQFDADQRSPAGCAVDGGRAAE